MENKKQEKIEKEVQVMEAPKEQPKGKAIDKYTGKYILKSCVKTWIEQIDPAFRADTVFHDVTHRIGPLLLGQGVHKTGLTEQEAREFEDVLGLQSKALNPYSPYWGNFKIYASVLKDGTVLDLDNSALDKLRFCFLKVHPKVTMNPNSQDPDQVPAEYTLTSTETEAKIKSSEVKVKKQAFQALSKMTISEQMDFLKVYKEGKFKVKNSSSPDFIEGTIGKIVDEQPQEFLDTVNNPYFKSLTFLQDCVQAGLVKKSGPKYFVTGGDMIGETLMNTIENLNRPDYQEMKLSLKAKLEALK